ncbi:ATP synthase F1 subunit epsilon [Alkalinema sp. FACHB-956]|uniref:ATP synthase F1 subunit epsilon n=1 Tax=Alkalinema sp. FACHB-956 TaxID=2692768 RepID=UPI0016837263|nr:ATP synthase F1 subunit epsilon [Alkalinema sp. FACHB-956]MBD2327436.1 F0F1 ATP synthase subunit epsilon [Alkalinema sp. FACHB-956]
MSLTVRVIAPDKTVWDATAEEVILPSTTGQLGILTGHAPLLTALETGVMRVRADKNWTPIALMGGFAEVESNEVTVLVNGAERGADINLDEARKAFGEAEVRYNKAQSGTDRQELLQASQAFKRARARVQAAGGNA